MSRSRSRKVRTRPTDQPPGVRLALLAAVGGAMVVFWPAGLNEFALPKAIVLGVGAGAAVLLVARDAIRTGRLVLYRHPVLAAVGAFALALVVATLASDDPVGSVFGWYGRFGGLLLYVSGIAVLVAGLAGLRDRDLPPVLGTLVAAGTVVALVSLLQEVGLDPTGMVGPDRGLHENSSTFGNPNFTSAAIAVTLPLALAGAVNGGWTARSRVLAGAAALVMIAGIAVTGSVQGVLAGAAGSGVLVVAWLQRRGGRVRTLGLLGLAGALALGGAVVVAGLLRLGPLAALARAGNVRIRRWYWETALNMFADHPITGVGPGRYNGWYRAYRSQEAALELPVNVDASAAHSVPLELLGSGGLLVAGTYLAVVAIVAWTLVRALRRSDPSWYVAGFGGAWLAWQGQSVVSIDQAGLIGLHWLLAAAVVVACADRPPVELRLPGLLHRPAGGPGRQRRVADVVTWVGGAALLWAGALPWAANQIAGTANHLGRSGAPLGESLSRIHLAQRLMPWESELWIEEGKILLGQDQREQALEVAEEAARREPRNLEATLTAGELALRLGQPERSARWLERALHIEPKAPDLMAGLGSAYLGTEDVDAALRLLERAVALEDDHPGWWVRLGRARARAGDTQGARAAFERSLELDPDQPNVRTLIERLDADDA